LISTLRWLLRRKPLFISEALDYDTDFGGYPTDPEKFFWIEPCVSGS
jgi:hypothetical protein